MTSHMLRFIAYLPSGHLSYLNCYKIKHTDPLRLLVVGVISMLNITNMRATERTNLRATSVAS